MALVILYFFDQVDGRSGWSSTDILVPIALFASLSRCALERELKGPIYSPAKASPDRRGEKDYVDENGFSINFDFRLRLFCDKAFCIRNFFG